MAVREIIGVMVTTMEMVMMMHGDNGGDNIFASVSKLYAILLLSCRVLFSPIIINMLESCKRI